MNARNYNKKNMRKLRKFLNDLNTAIDHYRYLRNRESDRKKNKKKLPSTDRLYFLFQSTISDIMCVFGNQNASQEKEMLIANILGSFNAEMDWEFQDIPYSEKVKFIENMERL